MVWQYIIIYFMKYRLGGQKESCVCQYDAPQLQCSLASPILSFFNFLQADEPTGPTYFTTMDFYDFLDQTTTETTTTTTTTKQTMNFRCTAFTLQR